ncbi:MAG: cytochrome b/b6 domain-containing protein [Gammaproteobacteria bacterium]|nr:cytochrome b/b6 domain-containing protein [Gammaproteobacteria bacterium]
MNTNETVPARDQIRVWDPLVRLFHWSLVAAFAIAWLTGDEESRLHEFAGYTVIGLVLFRVLWGFVGTKHARFRDFACRPSTVLAYARDLLAGKARRYLGHNPLGGVMIIALLLSLLVTGVTGMALLGAKEGRGPLAGVATNTVTLTPAVISKAVADDDGEGEHEGAESAWGEVHEFFANLTLLLVVLHVAGVIMGSLAHRENLVRAMFTGRKRAQIP